MPTQGHAAQPLLRPLMVALTLSMLCIGFVFLMASRAYAGASPAGIPAFTAQRPFGIGLNITRGVAVADMNGDGHLDIITGEDGGQSAVSLGDGNGGFISRNPFGSASDSTWSVAVADVDGQNGLDIIAGHYKQQSVVYLNQGRGEFYQGAVDCKMTAKMRCFGDSSDATQSVVAANIDGNRYPDIVVGNYRQQSAVYLNNGTSTFTKHLIGDATHVADATQSVVVANVDGTGGPEIIVGNNGQSAVYSKDGSGNFAIKQTFGPITATTSITVTDMNNDGRPDIVAGHFNGQSAVYLNMGGTFATNSVNCTQTTQILCFGGPQNPTRSVAVADVNGDHHPDIVVGNDQQQSVVYLNGGNGAFYKGDVNCDNTLANVPANVRCLNEHNIFGIFGRPEGSATYSVAVGDINGDTYGDVIAVGDREKAILLNSGATFQQKRPFGEAQDHTTSVAVGNMDGQNGLDVVVGNDGGQSMVYLNSGTGIFTTTSSGTRPFGTGSDPTWAVVVTDVDHDSSPDIVVGNYGKQSAVYLNNGNGKFTIKPFGPITNITGVAVGDLDGMKGLDIVAGNDGGQNVIYLNHGNNTFDTSAVDCKKQTTMHCFGSGSDATHSVAVGDVDGKLGLDLVVGNDGGQSMVYLNNGTGVFTTTGSRARPFGGPSDHTRSVAVADVNGDNHLDLVVGNDGGQSMVYLNDGTGGFTTTGSRARPFGGPSDHTRSVAVADINGDGAPDLIVGNNGGQSLVYLNDGKANFTVARPFGGSADPTVSIAVGDVNGDSALDIVAGNYGGQSMVYLSDAGTFGPAQPFADDAGTASVAVGDVDGQNGLDLVVGNYGGQGMIYFNNGTGNFTSTLPFGTGLDRTISVALGDVNGDGALDIIAGNDGGRSMVYLNKDDTFATGQVTCAQTERVRCFGGPQDLTRSVVVGNVDGKNGLDIVAGNYGGQSMVYFNDGKGHFTTTRPLGGPSDQAISVAVGDVDGKGGLDLVVGSFGRQSMVYFNDGQGNFLSPRSFGTITDIGSVAIGNVDGQNGLDIVAGNYYGQSLVYLNDGQGNFATSHPFGGSSDPTWSVTVGDVNDDGALDIVAGNYDGQSAVYLNDGQGIFTSSTPLSFGGDSDRTLSVALADVNGAKGLDIVAGNYKQPSAVYLNDGNGIFPAGQSFGTRSDRTTSVAVGNMDGQNGLDIVAGNDGGQSAVYLNMGGTFATGPLDCAQIGKVRCFGGPTDPTNSLAVGDVNGDGTLDIVAGNNGGQNAIFFNSGGGFGSAQPFGASLDSRSVALGDLDGDGDLDIVAGNFNQPSEPDRQPSAVYLNNGTGVFTVTHSFGGTSDATSSIAVGDINGDGALDIVAGNSNQPSVIYLNDGAANFYAGVVDCARPPEAAHCFGTRLDRTRSVAVGDMNGDGALDIIAGNDKQPSLVYLNDGTGAFYTDTVDCTAPPASVRCFGTQSDATHSIAVGDVDGDGTLDIVAGNDGGQSLVYLNDGKGNFTAARLFGGTPDDTASVAVGDLDGDGDFDLVAGNDGGQSGIFLNSLSGVDRLANNPPRVTVIRPSLTQNANFFSTPEILSKTIIPISYTLFDPEGDPVQVITATYSPDGGGHWLTAVPTNTQLTDLATCRTPDESCSYTYNWDTFASQFFGQSDNVVFRILAYSQSGHSGVSGPYQRPYAAAQTFPFRVRGTQVQVVSTIAPPKLGHTAFLPLVPSGRAVPRATIAITSTENAQVYRLPANKLRGAEPLGSSTGQAFLTNSRGYLQGRDLIAKGDHLMALLPMTTTDKYTLYYTNLRPTATGLYSYTVTSAGLQQLLVSPDNPLVLFKLKVSLEWDARYDEQFKVRLSSDLKRTSELLYDWTNGQAALGQITVYQNKELWEDADIRIYASNRVRPNAIQGGVVSSVTPDPANHTIGYAPGQVSIGAIWNRYGESTGNLGEDWPRALAHELGHYLFYLDDNYLGVDKDGLLVPLPENPSDKPCPGVMNDPYGEEYSEFDTHEDWNRNRVCAQTLAAHSTGRWDWGTITTFYPWLDGITPNPGPRILPMDLTLVDIKPIESVPAPALSDPVFYLVDQSGRRIFPGNSARAFLFRAKASQSDQIVDLGRPTLDQVLARGALPAQAGQPGDQVCVYEMDAVDEGGKLAPRLGCARVIPGDEQLKLEAVSNWPPELIITPVTSRTIEIIVTMPKPGQSVPGNLKAQLFTAGRSYAPSISRVTLGAFAAIFSIPAVDDPALAGYIKVWVNAPGPRREIVTDYALGGGPVNRASTGGVDVNIRLREAPAVSADGQVILFTNSLNFKADEILTLQTATALPSAPSWVTVVGQAYRLTTRNLPDLTGKLSISFNYLGREVPPGQEQWLTVYYQDPNPATCRSQPAPCWRPLPTRLNTRQNVAPAATQGPGLYALMSSIDIPLKKGWNLFAYPVNEEREVRTALKSIEGSYTTIYTYDPTDPADPWKIYDVNQPEALNDLKVLKPNYGYWIRVTEDVILRLKGSNSPTTSAAGIIPGPSTDAAILRRIPHSPATYYGVVQADSAFMPTVGMTVIARVNGAVCGRGRTLKVNGQVMYTVDVDADRSGAAGCGVPGRKVTFQIGPYIMATTAPWDSDQPHELSLRH